MVTPPRVEALVLEIVTESLPAELRVWLPASVTVSQRVSLPEEMTPSVPRVKVSVAVWVSVELPARVDVGVSVE